MNPVETLTESVRIGVVVAVCISAGGVPKHPVNSAVATADGLEGDGRNHARHLRPERAVSMQNLEVIEELVAEGYPVGPGTLGENLTVRGLDLRRLASGDRLYFQGGPVLEITELRKPCFVINAIHPDLEGAVAGRCGVLCRVVRPGVLSSGQHVVVGAGSSRA